MTTYLPQTSAELIAALTASGTRTVAWKGAAGATITLSAILTCPAGLTFAGNGLEFHGKTVQFYADSLVEDFAAGWLSDSDLLAGLAVAGIFGSNVHARHVWFRSQHISNYDAECLSIGDGGSITDLSGVVLEDCICGNIVGSSDHCCIVDMDGTARVAERVTFLRSVFAGLIRMPDIAGRGVYNLLNCVSFSHADSTNVAFGTRGSIWGTLSPPRGAITGNIINNWFVRNESDDAAALGEKPIVENVSSYPWASESFHVSGNWMDGRRVSRDGVCSTPTNTPVAVAGSKFRAEPWPHTYTLVSAGAARGICLAQAGRRVRSAGEQAVMDEIVAVRAQGE